MIIGFAGNLQSGKSSSCRYVVGEIMKKNNLIKNFGIDDEGKLIVPDRDGNYGIFDFESNNSQEMKLFCQNVLYKMVRVINFADSLKDDCCKYFGLPRELVYGGKKDKETLLSITWNDLESVFKPVSEMDSKKKKKRMCIREVLVTYADMVRSISSDAFINSAFYKAKEFDTKLVLIGDVRYENEIKAIHENGGKVIRLGKIVELTGHSSEQTHTFESSMFDLDIDNSNLNIKEKNMKIKESLIEWGVI
jgi:hypothetical protein